MSAELALRIQNAVQAGIAVTCMLTLFIPAYFAIRVRAARERERG